MANKIYKVKRVVDTRVVGGQVQCKVRWSGYAKEKDHTWWPLKTMKNLGLQRLVLLYRRFVIWRNLQQNRGRTQADFEATLAHRLYGANMKANCVVVALRNAGRLIGLHDFCSSPRVARFKLLGKGMPRNIPWETVKLPIDHCNRQQRLEQKPMLTFRGKKDNILKRSLKGYVNHALTPGVYVCGVFDADGTGHCFALESKATGECYFHDPAIGKGPVLYCESSATWIKSWNFVIPFRLKK